MKYLLSILIFLICWMPDNALAQDCPPPPPPPPPRHEIRQCLEQIKQTNPQEYERLIQLHQHDRRAFMHEIMPLIHKDNNKSATDSFRRQMADLDRKCWEIATQIQQAIDNNQDYHELERQLEDLIRQSIDLTIANTRQRINELQEKVKNIENDRENIQQQRLDFFISTPPPPPPPMK